MRTPMRVVTLGAIVEVNGDELVGSIVSVGTFWKEMELYISFNFLASAFRKSGLREGVPWQSGTSF